RVWIRSRLSRAYCHPFDHSVGAVFWRSALTDGIAKLHRDIHLLSRCRLGRGGGDPPNRVSDVIRDPQRARLVDGDADRTSPRATVVMDKAGQHVDGRARRPTLRERYEDHPIAAQRFAVPRAVLADEGTALERLRQRTAGIEGEAERRRVVAERVIGN